MTKPLNLMAAAWELCAFSLRYPTLELAEALASGEWLDAAREIADALELSLPAGFGEGLPATSDVEGVVRALRTDATRLMVGMPDPAVSPYEGVWRAKDAGVQPLLFVNPHSMDVERFCRACGLGRPEGTNEPLDHVATECELMQFLAMVATGRAAFPEGADPAAVPAGGAAEAYELFMAEHVMAWMPRFAEALSAEARHPFYEAVGHFLSVLLAEGGAEMSGDAERAVLA